MTNAPERIWIDDARTYSATFFSAGIPYVRADLFDAMTAERDAALAGAPDATAALIAAAYEVAASEAEEHEHFAKGFECVGSCIRALTPANAVAAQAARDRRMRAEGMREALGVLSGINGWTGLAHQSNMDFGPNTISQARAAIRALADKTEKGEV